MKIQLTSAAGLSLYPSNPFLKAQKREGDLKPLSHDDDLHTSSKSRKISSATAQSYMDAPAASG